MTKSPKSSPGTSPKAQASRDARAERQAKALRDNLHRRKQQARDRDHEANNLSGDSPELANKPE